MTQRRVENTRVQFWTFSPVSVKIVLLSVIVNDLGGGRDGDGASSSAADDVVNAIKANGGKLGIQIKKLYSYRKSFFLWKQNQVNLSCKGCG